MPLFLGLESVVAGHEHTSMSVITGQMPAAIDSANLPTHARLYRRSATPTALAQWQYCFDRGDTDTSRGRATSGIGNNWDCSVTGSLNAADPSWNATAAKLMPRRGPGPASAERATTRPSKR